MNKIYIFLSVFLSVLTFGQNQLVIYESYPVGQDYYVGGRKALHQEIKDISMTLGLQPCPVDQNYKFPVLVESSGSIKLVKDEDSLNYTNNKCAVEYGKKLLPHLRRWLAARVDGEPVNAIAELNVNPFIIYHSKPIIAQNVYREAQFKLGMNEFRLYMLEALKKPVKENENQYMVMSFAVSDTGIMERVEFSGSFDQNVIKAGYDAVEKLNRRKLWTPGTINGFPLYQWFKMPVRQEFSFEDVQKDNSGFPSRP